MFSNQVKILFYQTFTIFFKIMFQPKSGHKFQLKHDPFDQF